MGNGFSPQLGRLDPRNVVLMRQHLRPDEVELMLRRGGFEQRHRKGSHSTWCNTEFPDITFVLQEHHGQNNSNYYNQRDAAKACLEVIERQQQAMKLQMECLRASFQAQVRKAFDDGRVETASLLPAHIMAEQRDGYLVLRHKISPCIGAIAAIREYPKTSEKIFEQIDERARFFIDRLAKAQEELEIEIKPLEDGTWQIAQPTYMIGIKFKPYQPDNTRRVRDDLEDYCSALTEWDNQYQIRILDIIETATKSGNIRKQSKDDKTDICHMTQKHFLTGEPRVVSFETSKAGRIHCSDFWELQEKLFAFDMGPQGDGKYLKKILNQKFGIKMERPNRGKDGQIDMIICTHPLYPDLRCEFTPISDLPGIRKSWENYYNEKDSEKAEVFYAVFKQTMDRISDARNTIDTFTDDILYRMMEDMEYVNKIIAEAGTLGFQRSYSPRDVRAGEFMDIVFSHPQVQEKIRIPAVRLNDRGDIATKADVESRLAPYVTGDKRVLPPAPSRPAYTGRPTPDFLRDFHL